MDSIEILIPDKEGNHLVVALSFYDDIMKTGSLQIPEEFSELDIADISINKIDIDQPLNIRAFPFLLLFTSNLHCFRDVYIFSCKNGVGFG